jgi:hypothetical protein
MHVSFISFLLAGADSKALFRYGTERKYSQLLEAGVFSQIDTLLNQSNESGLFLFMYENFYVAIALISFI